MSIVCFFHIWKVLFSFYFLYLNKGERLQYDLADIFVSFLSYKFFLNVFCFPKFIHGFFVWLIGYVDIYRVCLRFLWLLQNITNQRKIIGNWHTNPPIVNKHCNAKIHKSPKFYVVLWYSNRGHNVMWNNPDIESKIIPLLFFTIALEMFFLCCLSEFSRHLDECKIYCFCNCCFFYCIIQNYASRIKNKRTNSSELEVCALLYPKLKLKDLLTA